MSIGKMIPLGSDGIWLNEQPHATFEIAGEVRFTAMSGKYYDYKKYVMVLVSGEKIRISERIYNEAINEQRLAKLN